MSTLTFYNSYEILREKNESLTAFHVRIFQLVQALPLTVKIAHVTLQDDICFIFYTEEK